MISSWQVVEQAAFAPTHAHYPRICRAYEILAVPHTPVPQFCPDHPTQVITGWDEAEEESWDATCHRVRLLDDATYHRYLSVWQASPAAYPLCSLDRELPADLVTLYQESVTGPLAGWEIIVPRPPHQARQMLELLQGHGATTWAVPTIAISLEHPRPVAPISEYAWAIATSTNAVAALKNQWETAPAHLRWAAVGAKTAQALEAWGAKVQLQPVATDQTAQGLLEVFPDVDPGAGKVWYPRADIAKPALAQGLRARGWQVEEVVAYRNSKVAGVPAGLVHTLKNTGSKHRLAICVTAGSTIKNLVELCGKPGPEVVVVTIGPRATEACAQLGIPVAAQASEASAVQLVQTLVGVVGKSA